MARILILFAHPALEKSRIHRRLIQEVPAARGITFHDLYEAYPTFDIDIAREQELLLEHDLIIFQHPFFWYSTPPIIKQWEDLVLEHGWAYGSQGTALRGKRLLSLITAGGAEVAYQHGGYNRRTIREFLAPIEQTARLCGMDFFPPYVLYGAHRLTMEDIDAAAGEYRRLLTLLHEDRVPFEAVAELPTLNEAVARLQPTEVAL
jgi:glutathione-regulated potassium-efflux system ancillary protein KefG